jgi:hypothetical protein
MMLKKYQLVLQFPSNCPLTSLNFEDDIAEAIDNPLGDKGKPHYVDGNAIGETIEIFIHTDDPDAAFELCKPLLTSAGLLDWAIVAYRKWANGNYEEFVAIWPNGYSGKFSI